MFMFVRVDYEWYLLYALSFASKGFIINFCVIKYLHVMESSEFEIKYLFQLVRSIIAVWVVAVVDDSSGKIIHPFVVEL